ncbi:putative NOT transcription complex subunit VIP2 [Artemisia annua]|uniref:Putative NOT transcription complex subunit VIP2 n=1 Tax=Artemisia annua TaxID=35608 RepID=A0A2U1KP14_ARTAN|nr:putative NOT transcription complex subunit VIP2 [Artemisia annua]
MSGLLNNSSLNGSASNLQDNTGRPFSASFSAQSGAPSPIFHQSGSLQGLHNLHGSFNVSNMSGTLGSRNSTAVNIPSSGLQQQSGNLSGGRFTSNNMPVALSQIAHGSSHGHSGLTSRGGMSVVGSPGFSSGSNAVGGSIPGILPTSAAISNRNSISGVGVSPILGNPGSRITGSTGNIGGGSSIGRSMSSGGGLSIPGLTSRLNLNTNSGSGNISVQGSNRLMGGMLQQASPQVMSMFGNSYHSGGQLSQNHVHNSMGMLNDVNYNDGSPFDINDFPQLSSRPSSSGGAQGQIERSQRFNREQRKLVRRGRRWSGGGRRLLLVARTNDVQKVVEGSLRKQGLGVSPIVQQNQEFSIQNEDFPALPGFKGGGNAEYAMDLQQKDQLHDNSVSMMQSPHFSIGRSSGFNLGGTFSSHRPQQQQHVPSISSSGVSFSSVNNQDLLHLHGSDMFQGSHSSFHSQGGGTPGVGLRPLNSPNTVSGSGSYDQLFQQYQQQQNQSQFRLQQAFTGSQSYRDQGMKSMHAAQASPDRFGLLGLLSVIRMSDPDLTSLALGIDLTTLGLNLNSAENLHKTFGSPWLDEPTKGAPEFTVPQCYYAKQAPVLSVIMVHSNLILGTFAASLS